MVRMSTKIRQHDNPGNKHLNLHEHKDHPDISTNHPRKKNIHATEQIAARTERRSPTESFRTEQSRHAHGAGQRQEEQKQVNETNLTAPKPGLAFLSHRRGRRRPAPQGRRRKRLLSAGSTGEEEGSGSRLRHQSKGESEWSERLNK
jgi:hypothetical protein